MQRAAQADLGQRPRCSSRSRPTSPLPAGEGARAVTESSTTGPGEAYAVAALPKSRPGIRGRLPPAFRWAASGSSRATISASTFPTRVSSGRPRLHAPASSARRGRTSASPSRRARRWKTSSRWPSRRRESPASVFTHLNTGYHFEDVDRLEPIHGLRQCEPFVRALRERGRGLHRRAGVPRAPAQVLANTTRSSRPAPITSPSATSSRTPSTSRALPREGPRRWVRRGSSRRWSMRSQKLGRGRVSGEIIAGLEPIEATKRGIDRIVAAGAFPTVCIFRPTVGSELETRAAPVTRRNEESLRAPLGGVPQRRGCPIGVLPIEVSLVVQPEECADSDGADVCPPGSTSCGLEALRLLAQTVRCLEDRARGRRRRCAQAATPGRCRILSEAIVGAPRLGDLRSGRDSQAALREGPDPGAGDRGVRAAQAAPARSLERALGAGGGAVHLGRDSVADARPGRAREARGGELLRGAAALPADSPAQSPGAHGLRHLRSRSTR